MFHNRHLLLCLLFAALVPTGSFAEPLDSGEVNPFDRALMFPYSENLDRVSDLTQYAAFLTPAIFLLAGPRKDYLEIGLLYAGSSALALGSRFGLKAIFERNRPYMYYSDPPLAEIANGDAFNSFPSGHAIMAFSGATFTATIFALRYPDSPYRLPATIGAFSLATATAAMRIASGTHFTSDILAGAAIGSLSGFIVPFVAVKLGTFGDEGRNHLTATPTGFLFRRDL